MPQRHRPRLKRYTIACSWCGASTVKLYPSRESVRRKLSPYRFCSSTCQRDHWEARRKAAVERRSHIPCAQCGGADYRLMQVVRSAEVLLRRLLQGSGQLRERHSPPSLLERSMAARERFKDAWLQAIRSPRRQFAWRWTLKTWARP